MVRLYCTGGVAVWCSVILCPLLGVLLSDCTVQGVSRCGIVSSLSTVECTIVRLYCTGGVAVWCNNCQCWPGLLDQPGEEF